jgi:hypothetical protein
MSSELQFVELDERVYKYIRQFTIKTTEDALIELITNCNDAYTKGGITVNKLIGIEFKSPNQLRVYDNAIGLTAQELHDCFLQVGKYTTTEAARGFFSRGAKDISAIGDIYFDAIKDGKRSQCFLNSDAYGKISIVDEPVTEELRQQLKIPANGLSVTIKLLPNFITKNPSDEAESISKNGILRDIVMDPEVDLYYSHIAEDDSEMFRRRLLFSYPEGELLLDLTYNVPNYPDTPARFVVYKSKHSIPQPRKENEMIFGFLLKSNTTVYENSTIDSRFRWNPYMNWIYGYLQCDKIHDMLISFDKNGATAGNPMPIIDPSRLTGLNKEHPFVDALLSIPKVRLDQILVELNQQLSQKSISLKEVDQLLDELAKYGLDIIEHEDIQVSFTPNYESQLAKAIEDDRANYVTTELNYLFTNNFNVNQSELDRYVSEKIVRLSPEEGGTFIVDQHNELVQIFGWDPSDPANAPKDILSAIPSENVEDFKRQPYVYRMSSGGQVTKLYIFEKGVFEDTTNPEESYVSVKNRKFQISFINDINLKSRYIIEYGNGVHIKLNTANEGIRKYLMTSNVQEGVDDLSLENVGSSVSLTFLEDVMTDILSEVIVENDITNGRLILDSDTFTNAKKVNVRKNEIVTKLEIPMGAIFDKYRNRNKIAKNTSLLAIIDQIGAAVWNYVDLNEQGQELFELRAQLIDDLNKHLE